MEFGKILEAIVGFCEREGISCAVVGAFGLHAYGLTRATYDLDFVTEVKAQPKVIPFLESLGYETLHVSAGYSNHLHAHVAMGCLDFVYVGGETSGWFDLTTLDDDLPTTREDVLAQRRLRRLPVVAFEDYLRFLEEIGPPPPSTWRARKGPRGPRPFDLPA